MKETYIGVDLGGTKLLFGEMDREGHILHTRRVPSGPLSQKDTLSLIIKELDTFLSEKSDDCRPAAIGLGLVGRVDSKAGIWNEIDSLRCDTIEICAILRERYGLPCFADNDVRSATKAEMLFGEGRTSRHFIYINVGTGIAAGFVSDGQLVSGGHFNAGEVGHTSSGIPLKVPCECGRDDCVEPVASGLGFDTCARLLLPQYPDTLLHIPEKERVSVKEVFELYDRDPLCRKLTDNAASALATLIMNLIRFNDPDTVILGGGVVASGFLFEKIRERLNPGTVRYVTNGVRLTSLDPRYIGLLGACSNAMRGMDD